jgi:hypothetical protein
MSPKSAKRFLGKLMFSKKPEREQLALGSIEAQSRSDQLMLH